MKKIVKIIIVIAFLIANHSCDTLELEPVSSISVSGFWQNQDDINAARIGCYHGLLSMLSSNYAIWGDTRSDSFDTEYGSANSTFDQLMNNTLNPGIGPSDWTALYRTVGRCNTLIDNISLVQ